ncbi:unnamed protein product [Allacma fusca]|uniref:procollagen-proline 4-dioxygenase n=1 Tax=Allacma fusca TaxID=39272 RepID=A0A8J2JMF8_9HEXA|nr:unnamed protein product [Allacma fusca]
MQILSSTKKAITLWLITDADLVVAKAVSDQVMAVMDHKLVGLVAGSVHKLAVLVALLDHNSVNITCTIAPSYMDHINTVFICTYRDLNNFNLIVTTNKSFETCQPTMKYLNPAGYFQLAFYSFGIILCCVNLLQVVDSKNMYSRFIRDLQDLERFETRIVKNLTQSLLSSKALPIKSELRRLVELYVRDFYQSCGFIQVKDVYDNEQTRISLNPICSYRLIRRVRDLLPVVISHKSFFRVLRPLWTRIVSFFWKGDWPHSEDVETVVEKILRLQQVYDFNVEQFASGWISTVQTNCTLNSVHCYEIGSIALKSGKYAAAIEWLELGKKKVLVDRKTSLAFVEFSLWNAIDVHNTEFDEDIKLDLDPVFFDREISHEVGDSKSAGKLRNLQCETYKGVNQYHDKLNYLGLCAGENFQSEAERSRLFCWYEFKAHPSLIIGPRKIEFLNRSPDIIRVYALIHDKEIQEVVSDSLPGMFESGVNLSDFDLSENRVKGQRALTTSYRTSVNSWYGQRMDSIWSRRIEQVTGLTLIGNGASENLQVASYSFGGHYIPHMDQVGHDYLPPEKHRVATFMFYFNDVEQGGKTAFTSLGVAATPIKGSAVFWYNVFKDGGADWNTMHGACPVQLGEKWAANKWIKSGPQFLNRKCSLKTHERFQIPVNNVYLPATQAQGNKIEG